MQTDLFQVHANENNRESQSNLDECRVKFNRKCMTVFNWLMEGKELTALWAANNWVASLPRRILDLKEGGVLISDRWESGIKVWYLTNEQKQFNKNLTHGKI